MPGEAMAKQKFNVKFWGTRGSVPVSGEAHARYGGNTSCIELQCGPHHLVFDAGTGIREAGDALIAAGVAQIDLFFSHSHYDHIIGLPYFAPIYHPNTNVTLWSGHLAGQMTTHEMVRHFMRAPWFPIGPDICRAMLGFRDFKSGDVLTPYEGLTIRTGSLDHPGGAIGYRVEWAGKVVALIFDTEHRGDMLDPAVLDLIDGADLVVYDCTYTDDEMPRRFGYGHSTWRHGIKLVRAANAGKLIMFHHAPDRSDDAIDAMEIEAQTEYPDAIAARDGLKIEL